MTEKITLELTLEELKLIDKYVEKTDDTYSVLMKIKNAYPKPKMEHQESGTVDKVEYDGHTYLRIVYDDSTSFGGVWWKQIERHKSPMNIVTDSETRNILEGLWYKMVKKGEVEENKSVNKEENAADDLIDRMIKKYQAQKLWNRLQDELSYDDESCDKIIDLVESWLPEPQNADGSQNVNTELLVDGFNHCLQKMKEMLS